MLLSFLHLFDSRLHHSNSVRFDKQLPWTIAIILEGLSHERILIPAAASTSAKSSVIITARGNQSI